MAIPESLLWVSAAILGVFIALEKSGERASWLDDWTASDLKPIDSHQQISRTETFFDLGISTLTLLWLLDIIHFPAVIRHGGVWITEWAIHLPAWFWMVVGAMLVFDVAYCLLRLMRVYWSKQLRLTTIITNVLWIALLAFSIAQPELLSFQDPVPAEFPDFLPIVNKILIVTLVFICIILAWETLTHTWRLVWQQ